MKKKKNYHITLSKEVEVDQDMQETAAHGSIHLPVAVYIDEYSSYQNHMVQRHWHHEIQITYVLAGELQFVFDHDAEPVILHEGEAIFINSNIIHMIQPLRGCYAKSVCVLFMPEFIYGTEDSQIAAKYVKPVVVNPNMKYVILTPKSKWQKETLKSMENIILYASNKPFAYELLIRNCVCSIWAQLLISHQSILQEMTGRQTIDNERLQKMLYYIRTNYYRKNISLEEIASSANISVSECCRCFQRMLVTSPFRFLILRRIKVAAGLLEQTNLSVSEISEKVGFNNTNYFIKQFKSVIKETPLQYRKSFQMRGKNE